MKILFKPMSTATTTRLALVIKFDVEVSAFGVSGYEAHQSIIVFQLRKYMSRLRFCYDND